MTGKSHHLVPAHRLVPARSWVIFLLLIVLGSVVLKFNMCMIPLYTKSQLQAMSYTDSSNHTNSIVVAICLATTSHGQNWTHPQQTSLVSQLLPSIYKSISAVEFQLFRIRLYVAFDEEDLFWQQHHLKVTQFAQSMNKYKQLDQIVFQAFPRTGRIPFNEITQLAYNQQADYIVRINDDSRFHSKMWIPLAIEALRKMNNIGVVGPYCPDGKSSILTHDMTHRTHLQIFPTYYPTVFKNWWLDDWITQVYRPGRSLIMNNWILHHDMHVHGTRYRVDKKVKQSLSREVKKGRQQIAYFIKHRQRRPSIVSICLRLSRSQLKEDIGKSLVSVLLSSMNETISLEEFQRYRIRIYIAVDEGDNKFWRLAQKKITDLFNSNNQQKRLDRFVFKAFSPADRSQLFNEITQLAYSEGSDYIVQVTDGLKFSSLGWISIGINKLAKMGNIGVISSPNISTNFLNHHMTHRTHLDIFKTFYPPDLEPQFLDDWIAMMYLQNRSLVNKDEDVRLDRAENGIENSHGQFSHLSAEITHGKGQFDSFMSSSSKNYRAVNFVVFLSRLCVLYLMFIQF